MEKVFHKGVEVDRCTQCKGIWFDRMEHELLRATEGSEIIDTGDPAMGRRYAKVPRPGCPVCGVLMVRMAEGDHFDVWYDGCPVCRGVFFDAGEFTSFKGQARV